MNRLMLVLAALLASGLIATGCGDDDDDGGDGSPVATESSPADTAETSPADTTEGDSTDTTSGDVDSLDEAVDSCKEGVQATAGQLSEDVRSDLEELCDKAASGDEEEVREASVEICRKIVEESVPETAGRDEALDACESSVP
jgi:hypothetical protein